MPAAPLLVRARANRPGRAERHSAESTQMMMPSACARVREGAAGGAESLSRLERNSPGSGLGGASPEEHEWSQIDKGTEPFKQDFWTCATQGRELTLDRYEASVIAKAARKDERLSAGGSNRVPDDYRRFNHPILRVAGQKKEEVSRVSFANPLPWWALAPGRGRSNSLAPPTTDERCRVNDAGHS